MILPAILSLALLQTGPGPIRGTRPAPLAGLDRWIEAAMARSHGVGLAIAIVKDDSVVYAKGFGPRRLGRPERVDPETRFAIGSITKSFTAATLGTLVDDGRLGWDDRAIDRLPGFELFDPAVTREIRVRDLLTHRSGLSRGDRLWWGSTASRAEVLRRVRFHRPSWGFRTQFGYNNIMFLAAGQIIPEITGQSWDQAVVQRIITPLGMTATTTTTRGLDSLPNVAAPHAIRGGRMIPIPRRDLDNVAPAGAIYSTVTDMARYLRAHLGSGTVGGTRVWSPEVERELLAPEIWLQNPEGLGYLYQGSHFLGYGFGWLLFDRAGRKIVEHSGGIDGMTSDLILVPEERLGVIVLTNIDESGSPLAYAVAQTAIDRYLGLDVDRVGLMNGVYAANAAKARADQATAERARHRGPPPHPLAAYTGTFDNPLFGSAQVYERRGKLGIKIALLRDSLPLEHWQLDAFRGDWTDPMFGSAFATFRTDPSGGIAGFGIEGIEQDFVRRDPAAGALACQPTDVDHVRLATRLSPYDSTAVHLGRGEARICYSRPALRGRVAFGGDLVPYGALWRTGANDPTTIRLPAGGEVAGIVAPPGDYALFTIPDRSSWTVILRKIPPETPATPNGDELGRASVSAESIAQPVERLTIRSETTGLDRAELVLEWDRTRVRIPVRAMPAAH